MNLKKRILPIILIVTIAGISLMPFTACTNETHVHSWGEWTVTTAASCTASGEKTRICTKDAVHTETATIPALEHDWGAWEVTTAATHTEAGEETRVCVRDNAHKETRPIAATGHDAGAWVTTKEATCTEEGTKELRCTVDGAVLETAVIPALEHDWGAWEVTTAATHTEAGEETRVCGRDNAHKETRPIEATGHDAGAWVTTKEATCTEAGTKELRCTVDGAVLETAAIPALEHDWGAWEVTTAPTMTETGVETRVCKNDTSHKETRTVAVLPTIAESITVTNGNKITATDRVDATVQLNVKIKYVHGENVKPATGSDVTFISNNHAVATVNSNGLITIISPGTTEIYVDSVYNNIDGGKIRQTVILTVNHSPIEEMALTGPNSYSMIRGLDDMQQGIANDKAQIALTVKYYGFTTQIATKSDVTFTSSNNAVASVDEDGVISFNGLGTATITVTSKYKTQGDATMEEKINIEVKKPIGVPELEVSHFETGTYIEHGDLTYYIKVTVKNITDDFIDNLREFEACYLDAAGKVIGKFIFTLDETPYMYPGDEATDGISSQSQFYPDGIAEVIITRYGYNVN